jgi:hypothetical protein
METTKKRALGLTSLLLWCSLCLLWSCTTPPDDNNNDASVARDEGPRRINYPLDDKLRLNHIQVLGTHNSYHIAPENPIDAWAYTHKPLNVQLGSHGIRQFELDLYWNKDKKHYLVQHIPLLDPKTTCDTFVKCLKVMKDWSDRHPQHLPMIVMLETKVSSVDEPPQMFESMEKEILKVWPRESILKPDDVQGSYATIQEAIQKEGWPTLGAVRGKILFFLLTNSKRRAVYTDNNTSLKGKLMFASGPLDSPLTAITNLDNPGDKDKILKALKAGILVRTRADDDPKADKKDNEERFAAALSSGAQFISTDFPYPRDDGYIVKLPGGALVRCNPILAPSDCTPSALEQGKTTP